MVILIPSLEGHDLIQVTEDYFRQNKPGQKEKDNGLILLVAKQERQIRIEVGYGLETKIPDGKAGAIIKDEIIPCFKDNDYNDGVINGVKAIITAIDPAYRGPNKAV